jgi:hypothetical protein
MRTPLSMKSRRLGWCAGRKRRRCDDALEIIPRDHDDSIHHMLGLTQERAASRSSGRSSGLVSTT